MGRRVPLVLGTSDTPSSGHPRALLLVVGWAVVARPPAGLSMR
jgi:hypothetical protein